MTIKTQMFGKCAHKKGRDSICVNKDKPTPFKSLLRNFIPPLCFSKTDALDA